MGQPAVLPDPAVVDVGGSWGVPPALSFPLPGTSAAIASDWVNGVSALGNVSWTFHVEVPAGEASAWLPPAPSRPWWLRVTEGGTRLDIVPQGTQSWARFDVASPAP